ncbi:MAG: hypothetical protein SXU28_11570 [Pseudomonadota bacterium]|nr:hypothetical protein [Pseudomonadota bacterium]
MASLNLTSFVVAPEARGRGYELFSAERIKGSWTLDIAMMLLAWSQLLRDEAFAVCIDLGDQGVAVCRGRFIRQLPSGDAVAVMLGVLLSNEQLAQIGHRTDLLASALPVPEEKPEFHLSPFTYSPQPDPADLQFRPELQLGWNDRYIECTGDTDRLEIVRIAIGSIRPVAQRSRVRSWATTDTLPSRGAINLTGQAQLLLGSAPDERRVNSLLAQVAGSRQSDGRIEHHFTRIEPGAAPASYDAYCLLLKLIESEGENVGQAAELAWSPSFAKISGQAVAEKLALQLAGRLKLSSTLRVLERMLQHETPAIRDAGEAAGLKVLQTLEARERLDENALPLIKLLRSKSSVLEIVLSGRGLERQNTRMIAAIAEIASEMLRGRPDTGQLDRTRLTDFAVELSRLATVENNLIDSALALVQSLPDESPGGLSDMLTSGTVRAFASKGEDALRDVLRTLVRDDFLSVSSFNTQEHAMQRMAAAMAALGELDSQS